MATIKNLGFMNGWKIDGVEYGIVKRCKELGHKPENLSDNARCLSTTICHECEHTYKIDSSG